MANRLLQLVTTDQKLLKAIITAETREEAFNIAKKGLPNYIEEDFNKEIDELKRIMDGENRLDEDQLGSVTGGAASEFQLLHAFSLKHGVNFSEIFKRWK